MAAVAPEAAGLGGIPCDSRQVSTTSSDFRVRQALTRAGVTDGRPPRGGVIAGSSRAGKTTVLDALRREVDDPVISAAGVGRTAGLVFSPVVSAPEDLPLAQLRWSVATAIRERSAAALFIDDADLLDDDAAAIVHSLAVHDEVPVYVACTLEPGRRLPVALRSLWKDGHLPRFDLPPLGTSEVHDYLVDAVGRPVTVRDVDAFARWCRGEPGILVDLVESSLEAEQWEVVSGTAILAARPVPPPALLEAVEETAAELNGDALAVAEFFGAANPVIGSRMLDWLPLAAMVHLVGMDVLLEAESTGVIVADDTRVRLALPYLADAVARRTPHLRRARIAGELAAAVRASAGSRPDGIPGDHACALAGLLTLTAAVTMPVADRLESARSALRLGDAAAARDLASADGSQDEDPDSAAVHTWALIHLNDLDGVYQARRRWGSDPSPAWRGLGMFLDEFRQRRDLGTRAFLTRHDGAPGGLVGSVVARMRDDRFSGAWFGFLIAETAMLVGRYRETRDLLDAIGPAADDDGLLVFHLVLVAERLEAAVAGADRACEVTEAARRASAWRSDQVCASADFVCGLAHSRAGRFGEALTELRNSAPFLAATRLQDWPGRLIDRIGVMTKGSGPGSEVGPVEIPTDPYALLTAGEINLDQAWVLAAADQAGPAAERLLAFGEGVADAAPTLAVDQFELAARLLSPGGDAHARLLRGTERVARCVEPAERVEVLVNYAAALCAADGAALVAVAEQYRRLGLRPVAADAYAQAAAAHRAAGDVRAAVTSQSAAKHLVNGLGGLASPAQGAVVSPTLTRREREVVALAAESLSNPQIADRLRLSVRTVEGHLLRACAKYGVRDRKTLTVLWREQQ